MLICSVVMRKCFSLLQKPGERKQDQRMSFVYSADKNIYRTGQSDLNYPSKHTDVEPTSNRRHVHRQWVIVQFLTSGRYPGGGKVRGAKW